MRTGRILIFIGGWLLLGQMVAQTDAHPLIQSYPGSVLVRVDGPVVADYTMVAGLDSFSGTLNGLPLNGRLTRMTYQNPSGRSVLEISRSYRRGLLALGADILFECRSRDCSPSNRASTWKHFNGITAYTPRSAKYVAAKVKREGGGETYVAIMVGKYRHTIDILETGVEKPLVETSVAIVQVDAGSLAQHLDSRGYVVLEGLYFDPNASTIKPESLSILAEVARLLRQRPELKLYVVGHTDMSGSFNHNMFLSEHRAQAVVTHLQQEYGVQSGRLKAYGVGPLSPQSTNRTEEGKALNRRVILVER